MQEPLDSQFGSIYTWLGECSKYVADGGLACHYEPLVIRIGEKQVTLTMDDMAWRVSTAYGGVPHDVLCRMVINNRLVLWFPVREPVIPQGSWVRVQGHNPRKIEESLFGRQVFGPELSVDLRQPLSVACKGKGSGLYVAAQVLLMLMYMDGKPRDVLVEKLLPSKPVHSGYISGLWNAFGILESGMMQVLSFRWLEKLSNPVMFTSQYKYDFPSLVCFTPYGKGEQSYGQLMFTSAPKDVRVFMTEAIRKAGDSHKVMVNTVFFTADCIREYSLAVMHNIAIQDEYSPVRQGLTWEDMSCLLV